MSFEASWDTNDANDAAGDGQDTSERYISAAEALLKLPPFSLPPEAGSTFNKRDADAAQKDVAIQQEARLQQEAANSRFLPQPGPAPSPWEGHPAEQPVQHIMGGILNQFVTTMQQTNLAQCPAPLPASVLQAATDQRRIRAAAPPPVVDWRYPWQPTFVQPQAASFAAASKSATRRATSPGSDARISARSATSPLPHAKSRAEQVYQQMDEARSRGRLVQKPQSRPANWMPSSTVAHTARSPSPLASYVTSPRTLSPSTNKVTRLTSPVPGTQPSMQAPSPTVPREVKLGPAANQQAGLTSRGSSVCVQQGASISVPNQNTGQVQSSLLQLLSGQGASVNFPVCQPDTARQASARSKVNSSTAATSWDDLGTIRTVTQPSNQPWTTSTSQTMACQSGSLTRSFTLPGNFYDKAETAQRQPMPIRRCTSPGSLPVRRCTSPGSAPPTRWITSRYHTAQDAQSARLPRFQSQGSMELRRTRSHSPQRHRSSSPQRNRSVSVQTLSTMPSQSRAASLQPMPAYNGTASTPSLMMATPSSPESSSEQVNVRTLNQVMEKTMDAQFRRSPSPTVDNALPISLPPQGISTWDGVGNSCAGGSIELPTGPPLCSSPLAGSISSAPTQPTHASSLCPTPLGGSIASLPALSTGDSYSALAALHLKGGSVRTDPGCMETRPTSAGGSGYTTPTSTKSAAEGLWSLQAHALAKRAQQQSLAPLPRLTSGVLWSETVDSQDKPKIVTLEGTVEVAEPLLSSVSSPPWGLSLNVPPAAAPATVFTAAEVDEFPKMPSTVAEVQQMATDGIVQSGTYRSSGHTSAVSSCRWSTETVTPRALSPSSSTNVLSQDSRLNMLAARAAAAASAASIAASAAASAASIAANGVGPAAPLHGSGGLQARPATRLDASYPTGPWFQSVSGCQGRSPLRVRDCSPPMRLELPAAMDPRTTPHLSLAQRAATCIAGHP